MNNFIYKRTQVTFALLLVMLVGSISLWGQKDTVFSIDMLDEKVFVAPEVYKMNVLDQGDAKAIFYETLSYKGKPTRAFAFIGIPKSETPVPAMVLVHGGGGRAFFEWVKIWNDRGYAAIAMSLEGYMPDATGIGKYTHDYSGPQRVGRFDDVESPLEDQWMYHAISDILLGHSLLASMPEIDADRIGITGISWGGILSSLVSGIDDRLKCAIPVYGAGFLYESKGHFGDFGDDNVELIEKKRFWDPAYQFVNGSIPTLWVNGDSDAHFSLNSTSHSFDITRNHAYMTIHPGMKHGHPPGWNPKEVPEIYAFADQILKGKKSGLGYIIKQPSVGNAIVKYESEVPVLKATMYYQKEPLTYRNPKNEKHPFPGKWFSMPLDIDTINKSIKVEIPVECRAYYINIEDARGFIISTMLVAL